MHPFIWREREGGRVGEETVGRAVARGRGTLLPLNGEQCLGRGGKGRLLQTVLAPCCPCRRFVDAETGAEAKKVTDGSPLVMTTTN